MATASLANTQTPPTTPSDYTQPLNEARALLAGGDYAGADRSLRTLLTNASQLADAHYLLGFALLHEEKPTAALAEYTEGARYREPRPEELIGLSLTYSQLKDFAAAEKQLTDAAKKAASRPLVWYLLGRAQFSEHHGGDAERSFLTCLRLDPHNLRAEYNLGLVYEMLKRPEEATTAYRAAIAWQDGVMVKDVPPYLSLGMMLRRQGKAADAVPFLKTAASTKNHEPTAHKELALAYEQLGKYGDAVYEMKAALAMAPQDEALHFFLGRLYREKGDREEAAIEFGEAARLSERQAPATKH